MKNPITELLQAEREALKRKQEKWAKVAPTVGPLVRAIAKIDGTSFKLEDYSLNISIMGDGAKLAKVWKLLRLAGPNPTPRTGTGSVTGQMGYSPSLYRSAAQSVSASKWAQRLWRWTFTKPSAASLVWTDGPLPVELPNEAVTSAVASLLE